MALIILIVPVALVIAGDIFSYYTISVDKRRGYHPNIQLWSLGFLFGVCANFLRLLQYLVGKVDLTSTTTASLIIIIVMGFLVVIIAWAIAKVCQS